MRTLPCYLQLCATGRAAFGMGISIPGAADGSSDWACPEAQWPHLLIAAQSWHLTASAQKMDWCLSVPQSPETRIAALKTAFFCPSELPFRDWVGPSRGENHWENKPAWTRVDWQRQTTHLFLGFTVVILPSAVYSRTDSVLWVQQLLKGSLSFVFDTKFVFLKLPDSTSNWKEGFSGICSGI